MPRFVVLEHEWNGIHCDFMLEDGEQLRTWAIDAPELVPGKTHRARELSKHRAIYLEYEGPISGDRGSVRRLAAGEFTIEIWSKAIVRVTLSGPQLIGTVELVRDDCDVSIDAAPWLFRLGNLD